MEKTYRKNWDAVVNLMDDEKRETVHDELSPCSEEEFLARYLEIDPDFEKVLSQIQEDEEE